MLRINLLPSYVTQRRLTKKLVPTFIGLFLLSVALPLAAYVYLHNHLVQLTSDANDAVAGKSKTDALKAQATTTLAAVGPIQAKLKFVTDTNDYLRKWVVLYNTLAATTPKSSFIYSGATVTGPTMAIKAYSPSVEEVGRYLQTMYHEPDFTSVVVDHIPAYPENIRHLYYLDGNLVFADGATGGGVSGAGSAPGGFGGGGFGGGRGGYPGGGGGGQTGQATVGAPANWTPDAIGPNGASNIPAGVGPPPPEIAVGGPAVGGGGQTGGGFSGGGQTGTGGYSEKFLRIVDKKISPFASPAIRDLIYQRELRRVVVKTVSKGFDINVTATLKEPLTPPVPPGGIAPAGTGSPGGYPGGGSGGRRGGYPGPPPPGGQPA